MTRPEQRDPYSGWAAAVCVVGMVVVVAAMWALGWKA